ncbi:hypothetical protein I6A84_06665 [Frankia sp. CNm7]|uniref:Uncharacterized protein n=1 Tax=Frankia nepalensis TaxID=1836974 RepID=A0A937RDM8_9ACTN|nr:hypothetical protein [Frankia nepalensis]MBL7502280.1 hypothetical protein [Frankia nepalensis]MBL7515750.1 hypothetical protein [Frankia nepalensis]MBL7517814.1 hypothetical protein [Frankia nepalensis]MBL7628505.1 hypothetical protein [Frankia nepalensis]
MPQLPRVAVLSPDLTGATALAALVDAGLDATFVGRPTAAAGVLLAKRALTGRWLAEVADEGEEPVPPRQVDEVPADFRPLVTHADAPDGSRRGFGISLAGQALGSWDALVVTAPTVWAATPLITTAAPWYGGVFHSRTDGVFLVGSPKGVPAPDGGSPGRDPRDPPPGPPADRRGDTLTAVLAHELIWAQASWIGEYLRGRYLPPARQAMLDHPRLRGTGLRRWGDGGYLRALDRELRAGRARAAAAGYPLPLPAAQPA